MQLFALCCLVLCFITGAQGTIIDTEELAEELRDLFLQEKANTDDKDDAQGDADGELEDEGVVDLRIIEDLLAKDEQGLAEDIAERMTVRFPQFMNENLPSRLNPILVEALQTKDEEIRNVLADVAQNATDNGFNNFYCLFRNKNRPRFVRQMRGFLSFLDQTRQLVEDGCP